MNETIKKENPNIVLELIILLYGLLMPAICAIFLFDDYRYFMYTYVFYSFFISGLYVGGKGGILNERKL